MTDPFIAILVLIILTTLFLAVVLPIVALVISIRSSRKLTEHLTQLRQSAAVDSFEATVNTSESMTASAIQELNLRIDKLESALGFTSPIQEPPGSPEKPEYTSRPQVSGTPVPEPTHAMAQSIPSVYPPAERDAVGIESIIGSRWLGWAAVSAILFAAAFFLKYAFENRWIGELGRVAIGVAAGISMCVFGFKYHKQSWRIFSQILTAGGIVLLYLSVYASLGYYHLSTQRVTLVFLAVLIAEAAGLAYLYNAPAIAFMALIGGFLTPILLRSDRDQYGLLFSYIASLDAGALALLKPWTGLSSVAFAGTHLLFWLWYGDNYHPHKLVAVMIFHTAVFFIFLVAQLNLPRVRSGGIENFALLFINPFVYFATAHHLLDGEHHEWMGAFAIGMALIYAGAAKLLLNRPATTTRTAALFTTGIALTFLTIAIPIQLRANWITIAWAFEALILLWAGLRTRAEWLRVLGCALFLVALLRLGFWDTPGESRPLFTPILNRYFLSSLFLTGCLFIGAYFNKKLANYNSGLEQKMTLIMLIAGLVTLWFIMSVETHTFFTARAAARRLAEDTAHEHWLGQMALSVLWSIYAGTLAAIGLVRRSASVRWAALALFALTVIKVMLVDMAELQQFYRIIVFFVLGVLLLIVAWGYHKVFYSLETPK